MIEGGWSWVVGAYTVVWATLGLYARHLARTLAAAERDNP